MQNLPVADQHGPVRQAIAALLQPVAQLLVGAPIAAAQAGNAAAQFTPGGEVPAERATTVVDEQRPGGSVRQVWIPRQGFGRIGSMLVSATVLAGLARSANLGNSGIRHRYGLVCSG